MRKYVSVLAIAARSTIVKITALLFAMAAAEAGLFWRLLQKSVSGQLLTPEELIERSGIPLICAVAFVLLCVILSLVGNEFSGSRTRYTLQRLSIREEVTVGLWAFYDAACFLMLWAVQLLAVLLLCRLYLTVVEPAYWNEQTIFLAFYRSDFLHSLLPLAETSRWLRNGALLLGLGAAAASFTYKQRRSQKGIAVVVLAVVTLGTFSREMGRSDSDVAVLLFALAAAGFSFYGIWFGKGGEDEAA